MTRDEITQRIEAVTSLLDLARADGRNGPRQAKQRAALRQAAPLAAERDRLSDKAARQWDWLDAHEDAPEATQREEQCLRTITLYTSVCDVLARVQQEVLAA